MTTDLDDQLNAIVSIPVHLLQYIDQECIIDNADDAAREAFNAALDRAFPDGPPGGCGGYISWDLRPSENAMPDAAEVARVYSSKLTDLAFRQHLQPQRSDGLAKTAARCVQVACAYSPSVKVAREALEEIERPDLRRAALELFDQLTTAETV